MDKEKENKDYDTLYEMEDDDPANLYVLPDDPDSEDEENDEEGTSDVENDIDNDDKEEEKRSIGSVFAILIKILTTPVEGWKELKRRKFGPERVSVGVLFPSIVIAALSDFFDMFYTTSKIADCMMNALNTFISFFFGYFTVMLLSGIFMPKATQEAMRKNFGKEFVMVNMSTLALFYAAQELFPMIDVILVFLPIWTIYLIYKGARFLRIPSEIENRSKITLTLLILGSPLLWRYLMDLFFHGSK